MVNVLNTQIDVMGLWRLGIFFGLSGIVLYFSREIEKIRGVGVVFAYFAIYALFSGEFPALRYGELTTAFTATGAQSFIELFLIIIFIVSFKNQYLLKEIFKWFILAEIASVWIFKMGIMNQTSFDCALIAIFVPFAPIWMMILSFVTVLFHHGSTALLILLAQFATLVVQEEGAILPAMIATPILFFVARMHNTNVLLNGSERIQVYKQMMSVWMDSSIYIKIFGTGSGSFMWLSLITRNFQEPHFLHLHSDWLQIVFEQGLVGLGLIAFLLSKTRLNPAVIGCCAFALTYHPLRFFPSALLVAFIFNDANKKARVL